MKTIIIAAMDRNGVIGRTSKVCGRCNGDGLVDHLEPIGAHHTCVHTHTCSVCNGTGRVPANDVPWSYPEIDAHFERETTGHAVVMGRRTWEARGSKPLDGRTNIVVSESMYLACLKDAVDHRADWRTQGHFPDVSGGATVIIRKTLKDAIDRLSWPKPNRQYETAYIHGGPRLIAEALPLADELDLTLIDREFEGDVKFPWSADSRRAASDLNPWAAYEFIETHGVRFDLVEQRQGSTPELTFTRWQRRRGDD